MARIKDSSIEQVKSAMEIVPVVEQYVQLRKAGATYKGLCPFHQERTPSFVVTPVRGTFKCFGCSEGGDAITFVEKMENTDFVGAIETLAKRFGVELEYEESSPEADRARRRRERLVQLLDRAAVFYERQLWDSDGGAFARDYLRSRGLGEEIARTFRLGYAPGGPTLTRAAIGQGFTQDELVAAGLANSRGNDYFNRRLLFPLADARGVVRGFQARMLHDDDPLQGKYVNTRESDLFKKGDLLYGLDLARQAIAKQSRAVIVEGNTDVIALRQAGFEPVVASMGTALTEAQLRELKRLTTKLFLCFDADAAGTDATLRGMELAVKQGFDIQVVSLPQGTDPADDPQAFDRQLGRPVPYLVHRVRLLHKKAPDRNAAYLAIRELLNGYPDSPDHQDARKLAADLLDLPPEMQVALAPARTRGRATEISPRLLEAGQRLERSALAGVTAYPKLARALEELGPEHFDVELHRRARANILGEATDDPDVRALVDELHALAAVEEIPELTAEEYLLRLRERRLERQLQAAPPEDFKELQQRLQEVRAALRDLG
ncbi:MAG: DNA primase [Actinomycetota bacterium]